MGLSKLMLLLRNNSRYILRRQATRNTHIITTPLRMEIKTNRQLFEDPTTNLKAEKFRVSALFGRLRLSKPCTITS